MFTITAVIMMLILKQILPYLSRSL